MESVDLNFWKGKKVFLTGHTGFKGSWLTLWLQQLGAEVFGYSLEPQTKPSLFIAANVSEFCKNKFADIRDFNILNSTMLVAAPEIVIHMAAQPLVRDSYADPVTTYATNVMGTVNVLESARNAPSVKTILVITTDKVYENHERPEAYLENEMLGGYDPYSSSKACAEIVTAAYRRSFFTGKKGLASARAGNVIGGGDWSPDRLLPDIVRAWTAKQELLIRNPKATRPWQHVLEPLSAYLILAQQLSAHSEKFSQAWNFGPGDKGHSSVENILQASREILGSEFKWKIEQTQQLHEAQNLNLNINKAKSVLGWQPKWNLQQALEKTLNWYSQFAGKQKALDLCLSQIAEYKNE